MLCRSVPERKQTKRKRAKMDIQSCNTNDFQALLQAIKSSDVVEARIQLIARLGDLDLHTNSEFASLFECLSTFWEDFTCLDKSQCMLNRTIFHVATKCAESGLSGCLVKFLELGTKASMWCVKHLKMTLMAIEEFEEEEHSNVFIQILLDFMCLYAKSTIYLSRYPMCADHASMVVVEKFILEILHLTKHTTCNIKRIDSSGSEVMRACQTMIDAVVRLCKEYSLAINWDCVVVSSEESRSMTDSEEANSKNHVINIVKSAIEILSELGHLAANDGGALVSILNASWKGVVTLLQLGEGAMMELLNGQDIVVSLLSLINQTLSSSAEVWFSSTKETISIAEARRVFLPLKFYFVNVVKISSINPCQVCLAHKEVACCLLSITTFRMMLGFQEHLRAASETFSELLEETLIDLLSYFLNSNEVKPELKFLFIDCLLMEKSCLYSTFRVSSEYYTTAMIQNFSMSCETMPGESLLLFGSVVLFHTLLRHSAAFPGDVKVKLAKKVEWFLDTLVDEDVYSLIFELQLPVCCASGKEVELAWQPMLSALIEALKIFIFEISSIGCWDELDAILLENIFHPHFLCQEIVTELWCFLLRHAKADMVKHTIDGLFSLMKSLASADFVLTPGSPLRKIAKIICMLINNSTPSAVDYIYSSVVDDDGTGLSTMYVALLLEGFPLNSLSDDVRSSAKQKIITDYLDFLGSFDNKLSVCINCDFGSPVFDLSASLVSSQVCMSDVELKTLKFLLCLIHSFMSSIDNPKKEHCLRLLSETLAIISRMKHLYESDEMGNIVLELQKLFLSVPVASDTYLCKPYLALFMGGLGEMKMSETDGCANSNAVWELYHMLLREKHWALVHLSIRAFGYFAAHTSCNQLWRFVPQDAALSYDIISGKETNEERFMSELKAFLEKEMALSSITPSLAQLELLVKEGYRVKEMVQRILNSEILENNGESDDVGVHSQSYKRRKLPDDVDRGIELLQSGLNVIADGISQWQQLHSESSEVREKFLTQFSHLREVIGDIVGLTSYH